MDCVKLSVLLSVDRRFCTAGGCAKLVHAGDKILLRSSHEPRVIVKYTPAEFRALRLGFQAGEFDDDALEVRANPVRGLAQATAHAARGTSPPDTQKTGGQPSTLAGPAGPLAPIPLTDTGASKMKPRPPTVGNGHEAEQPERQPSTGDVPTPTTTAENESQPRVPRALLTVRSALILLMASLSAIGAGWLLYAAHHSFALAVLGGAAAFAAAVPFLNSVIDERSR